MKKSLFWIALFLPCLFAAAQGDGGAEMADTFRREGKIYVVVAVILAIFAGIVVYLIRLDRKITKLEKRND